MSEVLLQVERLTVHFTRSGKAPLCAVDDVSFQVHSGSIVALVGESGSGKSVTALSLLGLLPKPQACIGEASRVRWQNKNLLQATEGAWRSLRGREIAMIFQDPLSALNPVLTVDYQLREALLRDGPLSRREGRQRALALLEQVGLDQAERCLRSYPHELSGGQQQRVMIAMAISAKPRLLIADEPTTALDVTVQRQIMILLKRLQQDRQLSILFITHDLALVGEFADEVVVMRQGRVVEQGSVAAILGQPQADYSRALLACRPTLHPLTARLPTIDGMTGRLVIPSAVPRQALGERGELVMRAEEIAQSYSLRTGGWRTLRHTALEPVSFALYAGQTLGVVGESGSGKSTLARLVAGIQQPEQGRLHWPARPQSDSRWPVQMVFQNPFASLNPRFTVAQLLLEPLKIHRLGGSAGEQQAMVLRWLTRVGLTEEALGRYPHEFSGGQRQRIAIARCLMLSPRLLICDESVAALDVSIQAQILNLLKDLQDELDISYLFISHDLSVVRFMADELLVLQAGQVREQGSVEQVMHHPRHPYTRQLLAAVPRGWVA